MFLTNCILGPQPLVSLVYFVAYYKSGDNRIFVSVYFYSFKDVLISSEIGVIMYVIVVVQMVLKSVDVIFNLKNNNLRASHLM